MLKCQVCKNDLKKYGKNAVWCPKCSIVWRGYSHKVSSFSKLGE